MKKSMHASRVLALLTALALAGGALGQSTDSTSAKPAPAARAAKTAKKPAVEKFKLILEPKAMDLLKTAGDKLASAKTMSFTAVVAYEYPSKLGPPLVYSTRYDVTMQRPNKLRILVPGDGLASEYYYDGKTVTAYAPSENLAAVADAPPTIAETLDAAYKKAAIFFPFEDLLVADPYAAMTEGAILAYYVGHSTVVGGVKTDMVAWANRDVHLQIWIGTEDKLPRRIRAIYSADPIALRHEVVFSDWEIDPAVSPDMFVSAKAQMAGRMEFAAPAPSPKGAKPLAVKSKSPAPAKAPTKTN